MLTENEIKLKLVEQLSDIIVIVEPHYFMWKDTEKAITDREWSWIVQECKSRKINYFNDISKKYGYSTKLNLNDWKSQAHLYFMRYDTAYKLNHEREICESFNHLFDDIQPPMEPL